MLVAKCSAMLTPLRLNHMLLNELPLLRGLAADAKCNHSHDGLDGDLGCHVGADGMLLDVQGCQAQGRVVLHLRGETLVQYIVTALQARSG